ncbi:hypothetical protein [Piscinibacter sp. HJYY11]|uniref:hypothetical protein n=1 Tax=Piscinibacter sp. HJYY11 TaxID=2801333 RepID=UPI00191FAC20|nr:hypothetical protein [Piscinibacter sp. HJYY11]MBL0726465.1 hypothetical protein [Piscinibacter sp. HJYY11]
MSYREDLASIAQRLRRAELDLAAWKASGIHERYMEAYFHVESLETEMLERMRRQRTENPTE